MKKMKNIFAILVVFLFCISSIKAQELFVEGKDNWIEQGNANWEFENNELTGSVEDNSGFLTTKEHYNDFILELEFKPDATINSGVFIRCENDPISANNCYEINIWDANPNPDYRTGGVVNTFARLAEVATINKWNTYKIKCKNNLLQVWVNDVLTADVQETSHIGGYIGLQARGTGKIQFRNIKISKLK